MRQGETRMCQVRRHRCQQGEISQREQNKSHENELTPSISNMRSQNSAKLRIMETVMAFLCTAAMSFDGHITPHGPSNRSVRWGANTAVPTTVPPSSDAAVASMANETDYILAVSERARDGYSATSQHPPT